MSKHIFNELESVSTFTKQFGMYFAQKLLLTQQRIDFYSEIEQLIQEMDKLNHLDYNIAVNGLWQVLEKGAREFNIPDNCAKFNVLFFCGNRTEDLDVRAYGKNFIRVETVKYPCGGKACNAFRMFRQLGGQASLLVYPSIGESARKVILLDHYKKRVLYGEPDDYRYGIDAALTQLFKLEKGDLLVLGGSFHPSLTIDDIELLLSIPHKNGLGLIIDCSLKFTSKQILKILEAKPLVIQCNIHEFVMLCQCTNIICSDACSELINMANESKVINLSRKIIRSYGINAISVTLRRNGAVLCVGDDAYFGYGFTDIDASTEVGGLGAGDSFCGAMAYALSKKIGGNNIDWRHAFQFALKVATAKVQLTGLQMPNLKQALNQVVIVEKR